MAPCVCIVVRHVVSDERNLELGLQRRMLTQRMFALYVEDGLPRKGGVEDFMHGYLAMCRTCLAKFPVQDPELCDPTGRIVSACLQVVEEVTWHKSQLDVGKVVWATG